MANSHVKGAQHHISLGYCKIKQDTTTHLLDWPKSRKLATPNDDKNMEQKELSLLGECKMVQPPKKTVGTFLQS